MRQDRPGNRQQAEHVDVEERACFRVGGFFDRAHQAATGVVDQDIDAAEPIGGDLRSAGSPMISLDLGHRSTDRLRVHCVRWERTNQLPGRHIWKPSSGRTVRAKI